MQSYAFPNEYSIPTIPLPPEPSIDEEDDNLAQLKPPESPPRFRRRDPSSVDSTPTKTPSKDQISVRFDLPDDSSDLLPTLANSSQPVTSTPNPTTKTQQFLDEEADSFQSAQELISAYHTPSSPSRGTLNRFRRTLMTPALPGRETPSKLLRTLSRATSHTPASLDGSVSIFQTPLDQKEEDVSFDEAEKTLDSIIESADEASARIRRVLEQSREDRALRQSLSPSSQQERSVSIDESQEVEVEMSVWGEKSFFRRMAMKAPGGWAFTPQPKLRRVDLTEVQEDVENIDPVKEKEDGGKWWGFWRRRRKSEEQEPPKDEPKLHPPKSPSTTKSPPKSILKQPKTDIVSSPAKPQTSITVPPSKTRGNLPLSALSEKRLRLARSLSLLQSDIRLAREGIETLETRLEAITAASTARHIDSQRALTLRQARGDPPPVIAIPVPLPRRELPGGTYLWLPFRSVWVIFALWCLVIFQVCVIFLRSETRRGVWEPYSFGEWEKTVKWPT
jgi:hypothetical protein